MRTFDVYCHPLFGVEAVKRGFSWPAFLFPLFWLPIKGLWGWFVLWVIFFAFLNAMGGVIDRIESEAAWQSMNSLLIGGWIAAAIVPGVKGNEWFAIKLLNRRYTLMFTVQSPSGYDAIMEVRRKIAEHDAVAEKINAATSHSTLQEHQLISGGGTLSSGQYRVVGQGEDDR